MEIFPQSSEQIQWALYHMWFQNIELCCIYITNAPYFSCKGQDKAFMVLFLYLRYIQSLQ